MNDLKKKKIVVVGAGAMGTLISARLCLPGHEVWILEVNDYKINRIRERGVLLEEPDGRRISEFPFITSSPLEIGTADAVVFLVKAFDTETAVQQVLPVIAEKTAVLTLQNGIGNLEIISQHVPGKQLLAGTTSHGALLIDAGHVRHTGEGETIIGALAAERNLYAEKMKALLDGAGIGTTVSGDVNSLLWGKLLVNMSINPLTAIMRIKNGDVFNRPQLVAVIKEVIAEGLKTASNIGVNIPYDHPLDKVKQVCRMTSENNSSMLQDVMAGRKTEIDQINGAVVRLGESLGTETPVNRMLTQLVSAIAQISSSSKDEGL